MSQKLQQTNMKYEDTICHNVTLCIEEVEKAIKTRNLNVMGMVEWLHKIREQAYKMEEGLTKRKTLMKKANIEEVYQKTKKGKSPGINKLPQQEADEIRTPERLDYKFIVKNNKTGEVLYDNDAWAGVMVFVEKIADIDKDGYINGTTQKLFFGSNLAVWYGFDQLRQSMEAKAPQMLLALWEAVKNKQFDDPQIKEKILKTSNGFRK